MIIRVHRSLLLTQELVYGHRTVATNAPGIETLHWSRNKQWNDTHLDSDAVQPITIHTQIETVDSNKPIRRRHDPRHEWHLRGNKQRSNDKYGTVKYCCHQMAALLWYTQHAMKHFCLKCDELQQGNLFLTLGMYCVLYVINRINLEQESASSARFTHSTSLLSNMADGEKGNALCYSYKLIALFLW